MDRATKSHWYFIYFLKFFSCKHYIQAYQEQGYAESHHIEIKHVWRLVDAETTQDFTKKSVSVITGSLESKISATSRNT